MSYRRYNQIKKYLHTCDEALAQKDRTHPEYDKLYKIRFLVSELKEKFMHEFSPAQDISVDECMIPFCARWSGRCYDSSKPIKWGVKVWMACCANTGYAYNLDVFSGRDRDFDVLSTVGNSAAVVLKLVQSLWSKGYHIYTDRYYTSPSLLHWLRRLDLSGTGTVMTNRKQFPKQLVKLGAEARALAQGDSEWLQCHTTGIVATRWTDKKPIYFLSNGLRAESTEPMTVTRRNKQGEKLTVPAPPTVVAYNQRMGGVDLNDKMARLDRSRKSYKWYTRIDRKCMHWALYNSYLLYVHNPLVVKPMEFRRFSLTVLTSLVGTVPSRKAPKPVPISPEIRFSREHLHCPTVPGSKDHRCAVCEKKFQVEKARRVGVPYKDLVHKSVKSVFYCETCSVFLCIKRGSTCWADYHSKIQYWR
jgi:hypothetical protein